MIKLGPAGTGGNSLLGVENVKELALDAVEIEFTYGVKMSNQLAKQVGELAKKLKIDLSVHAPYYINLSSDEKEKIIASKKRILDSCERGHHLGATHIVFHAGFYTTKTKEETYRMIKEGIMDLLKIIKQKGWNVELAPETTGKATQFGDLDELLKLHKETGCSICVDFAHLLSRDQKIDYDQVMKKLKDSKINHFHCHFSGIEYAAKGERRHILTGEDKITDLLKHLKKYKINCTIINESPDPIGDSIKSKKILAKLK